MFIRLVKHVPHIKWRTHIYLPPKWDLPKKCTANLLICTSLSCFVPGLRPGHPGFCPLGPDLPSPVNLTVSDHPSPCCVACPAGKITLSRPCNTVSLTGKTPSHSAGSTYGTCRRLAHTSRRQSQVFQVPSCVFFNSLLCGERTAQDTPSVENLQALCTETAVSA